MFSIRTSKQRPDGKLKNEVYNWDGYKVFDIYKFNLAFEDDLISKKPLGYIEKLEENLIYMTSDGKLSYYKNFFPFEFDALNNEFNSIKINTNFEDFDDIESIIRRLIHILSIAYPTKENISKVLMTCSRSFQAEEESKKVMDYFATNKMVTNNKLIFFISKILSLISIFDAKVA